MNTTALLLSLLVKSTIVLLAGAGAAWALRRRASAAGRHLVWSVTMGAVLLLPAAALVLPAWRVEIPVAADDAAPAPRQSAPAGGPFGEVHVIGNPAAVPSSTDRGADAISQRAPAARLEPAAWWLIAYAAGLLLLMARLGADRWTLSGLTRRSTVVSDPEWIALLDECRSSMGVTAPVRLLRSLDRAMPMAFGVRQPTVVMPCVADTWDADRRRAVLLHELAHVARRDALTQLVSSVTCALYWMHPAAWFAAYRLRVERELACDDRVLSIGQPPRAYAEHLLELAYSLGGFPAPAAAVTMARPKQLEGRMLAVLDHARNRAVPGARRRALAVAAAAALVVPVAALSAAIVPAAAPAASPASSSAASPVAPAAPAGPSSAAADQGRSADAQSDRRGRAIELPGTWELRESRSGSWYVQLRERRDSNRGFRVETRELDGLPAAALSGADGPVKFSIRRDAGTLEFEGTFRNRLGAGTFDFTPSATFGQELARRGLARPTRDDLFVLATGNIGTAYLDELRSQRYADADLDQLLRASDHGVSFDYLRDMGGLDYRVGSLEALIRMRDHGVDPIFIKGLRDQGLPRLTDDELVRARDHGVDPSFVRGMKDAGYAMTSLDDLIGARDHGVDPAYVSAMDAAGLRQVPLRELIRARDHGVDGRFVKDLRAEGFTLDLDELVRARDHGVDARFAAGFTGLGYRRLDIDDLVRMRDHGVSASFAREQNSRRGSRLSVDELVRIRDRGGN